MNSLVKLNNHRNHNYSIIQENRDLLYSGVYRLCIHQNRFFWKSQLSYFQWIHEHLFIEKLTTKKFLRLVFLKHKCLIDKDGVNACGDWLYISRKGNLKVFDHKKNTVTYYLDSVEEIDKAFRYQKEYADIFGKSIIISIDSDKKAVKERLIIENQKWRDNAQEIDRVINWLFSCSAYYILSAKKQWINISDFIDNTYLNCSESELGDLILDIKRQLEGYNGEVLIVFQHNDAVLSNVLKDDNGYVLFDYEFSGDNIFYYDSLMLIMWESIHYECDELLYKYLNGKFDTYLEGLFESAGIVFSREKKREYAYIFLLANLNVHIKTGDKTNIDKYRRTLKILMSVN